MTRSSGPRTGWEGDGRLGGSNKLGRTDASVGRTSWEGLDVTVGRTSWEGGSGKLGASRLWSWACPRWVAIKNPRIQKGISAGARSWLQPRRAQFSAAPFL